MLDEAQRPHFRICNLYNSKESRKSPPFLLIDELTVWPTWITFMTACTPSNLNEELAPPHIWLLQIFTNAGDKPRALLHHPRDPLKDLILAGHVITIA